MALPAAAMRTSSRRVTPMSRTIVTPQQFDEIYAKLLNDTA
jgi:hypothetical protein